MPDLPDSPTQRHYVQALYHLTKTLDPTRPVVGNDGWESVATDILAIHDYDHKPERITRRYHSEDELPRLLGDLIAVLHPELLPGHEFGFLRSLHTPPN